MTTLNNWSFQTTGVYCPPECSNIVLNGETQGHPRYPDGSRIQTTPIALTPQGFTSFSGREWTLGTPSSETTLEGFTEQFISIVEGLAANGRSLADPRNPHC